jgi:site-specific DNA-adenine methylase
MPKLLQYIPTEIKNYYEPFAGGGALFFEIHDRIQKAYLSDVNFDLVITYNVIKKNPIELIKSLTKHHEKHDEQAERDTGDGAQDVRRKTDDGAANLVETRCQHGLKIDAISGKAAEIVRDPLDVLDLEIAVSARYLLDQFGYKEEGRQNDDQQR